MIDANILFSSAGALVIFPGIAAYQAVDAFRWKDGKRGVIAVAAFSLLSTAAAFLLLFASKRRSIFGTMPG